MTKIPSKEDLIEALNNAGSTHHDYQEIFLKGLRDEQWAGFYAAYVIGRLGDFVTSSNLTVLLEEAPSSEDWATSAAGYVLSNLGK